MPGRGPQTFKKRQKEQQRKEKQQEKAAKRIGRKEGTIPPGISDLDEYPEPSDLQDNDNESQEISADSR